MVTKLPDQSPAVAGGGAAASATASAAEAGPFALGLSPDRGVADQAIPAAYDWISSHNSSLQRPHVQSLALGM